ncbi:hypothetical protein GGR56DRAFT_423406 [Xylariaceae sp. FL0804]|nr:hypothetical protein GGR56DRAFT_423406 [Xylariaceae sp. FL0804]
MPGFISRGRGGGRSSDIVLPGFRRVDLTDRREVCRTHVIFRENMFPGQSSDLVVTVHTELQALFDGMLRYLIESAALTASKLGARLGGGYHVVGIRAKYPVSVRSTVSMKRRSPLSLAWASGVRTNYHLSWHSTRGSCSLWRQSRDQGNHSQPSVYYLALHTQLTYRYHAWTGWTSSICASLLPITVCPRRRPSDTTGITSSSC